MAECCKTGKVLPLRDAYFSGYECREKERFTCLKFSYHFIDGTNCQLLRKPIDVRKILGMEKG